MVVPPVTCRRLTRRLAGPFGFTTTCLGPDECPRVNNQNRTVSSLFGVPPRRETLPYFIRRNASRIVEQRRYRVRLESLTYDQGTT